MSDTLAAVTVIIASSCEAKREVAIWRAVESALAQDGVRVDLQMVINLCTGMTAWLPDPAEAIAQVAPGVGILAATMAWTRPGWIEGRGEGACDPPGGNPEPQRREGPAPTADCGHGG